MNNNSQKTKTVRIAFLGLSCQIALAAALFLLGKWSGLMAATAAACFAGCGAAIWCYLWLDALSRGVGRLLSLLFNLAVALLLGGGGAWLALYEVKIRLNGPALAADPLQGLALSAGLSILAFGMSRYYVILIRVSRLSVLRAGVKYLAASTLMIVLICLGFGAAHLGSLGLLKYATIVIAGFSTLIGTEIILIVFLDFFRPRKKGEPGRSAFDSRLLTICMGSGDFGHSILEALDYQFGFEVSRTWIMQILSHSFWMTGALIFSTLAFLSAIVIVEPHQQAVISRFGRIGKSPLDPGLHWKAPWPLETASHYNVTGIRRIHVGSHRPKSRDGEVYLENVPILWSNLHGISTEQLLIVAPPDDIGGDFQKGNAQKTIFPLGATTKSPSVSLVGGDIYIEYRIRDLLSFIRHSNNTEDLFAQMAEAETSRELYRYDIDTLIGCGQLEAAPRIRKRIQAAVDKAHLGIEILKVGFTGVHPPQNVAKAFHQTIIASQELETAIESAKSYAIRIKTETAGTGEQADSLITTISKLENLDSKINEDSQNQRQLAESLLISSGGMVAEVMADAVSYRRQREKMENGKVERFRRQHELFQISPYLFPHRMYLATLERGLAKAKKIILMGNRDNLVLRFNFKDSGMNFYDMAQSDNRFSEDTNPAFTNKEVLTDR